ncbi:Ig-like domain-containing protein [Halospina sp. K52047b]|uniref:Ig-like domain-containing protein n=1 Tax=Halospina sp. K52047b TaxID=2614160 RepID=UPI00124A3B30|nr:Ig-like domain-containing protein [Halospina sp. K52047b]KAA8985144.1 hypothetical protein F3089_00155 [Halospina sp. K52047b]
MKRTTIGITVLTLALAGCMGSEETQEQELQAEAKAQAASSNSGLQFSYPIKGQAGFPTSAPMIVQFGMPITASEGELGPSNVILEQVSGDGSEKMDAIIGDMQIVGDGRTLRINTTEDLQPGARYRLQVTGVSLEEGLADTSRIEFTTASNRSTGTVNQRLDAEAEGIDDFSVARLVPFSSEVEGSSLGEGSSNFPFTNFNTLRVQFTQPVDESSVTYGENGSVRLQDSDGNLVSEAEVWVRGNRMVIDPEGVLKAGDTYELNFTEKLTSSLTGTTITGDTSWTFTPQEARILTEDGLVERDILAQEAVMGSNESMDYTGEDYNSVVLGATTLGQGNKTVQRGTVNAYMGHTKRFEREDKAIPLTVKQGTLMKGTSVDVLVGGALQTEFEESGEIDVRFLSDANGYMMMNPYSDSPSAPRVVRLFADLAMNTEKPRANGALAQELLHVELVGTATVEDDKLTLKAVSVIEPDVLGVDKASGLISFRLEAYNDPEDAPTGLSDSTGPQLKAWTPGGDSASGLAFENNQDKMQPQDPITLFFDEPLLPGTVNSDNVALTDGDGNDVAASVRLNGPNVIVDPRNPLSYESDYKLTVNGVTDLSGAPLEAGMLTLPFSLPESSDIGQSAPERAPMLVLTTRPGYPCEKVFDSDPSSRAPDDNGQCAGGITSNGEKVHQSDDPTTDEDESETLPYRDEDDQLPIEKHEADKPLIVRFSQEIDNTTITESTVKVSHWADGGWADITDDVEVEIRDRQIRIIPRTQWSTDEGKNLYRYKLVGGTSGIKSEHGAPIYTQILKQYPEEPVSAEADLKDRMGGAFYGDGARSNQLTNRFRAVEPNDRVLTALSNLATPDANSDLELGEFDPSVAVESGRQVGAEVDALVQQLRKQRDSATVKDARDLVRSGQDESYIPQNAAAMLMENIDSEVLVGTGAVGCKLEGDPASKVDCRADRKMIFKTAKLDVEVLRPTPENSELDGDKGVPVKLDPSILFTSSSDVAVRLNNDLLAALATEDGNADQLIPTGPMVMRMRYENESRGDAETNRNQSISGLIYKENGQLRFKTALDVYLDAPFLLSQLKGGGTETNLEDNMRSFPIDNLVLDGPIRFLEDGRMQITQFNTDDIPLDVTLKGEISVTLTEKGCEDSLTDFGEWMCEQITDVASDLVGSVLNTDTDMKLVIPKNALHLNYITPYTQQRE